MAGVAEDGDIVGLVVGGIAVDVVSVESGGGEAVLALGECEVISGDASSVLVYFPEGPVVDGPSVPHAAFGAELGSFGGGAAMSARLRDAWLWGVDAGVSTGEATVAPSFPLTIGFLVAGGAFPSRHEYAAVFAVFLHVVERILARIDRGPYPRGWG